MQQQIEKEPAPGVLAEWLRVLPLRMGERAVSTEANVTEREIDLVMVETQPKAQTGRLTCLSLCSAAYDLFGVNSDR